MNPRHVAVIGAGIAGLACGSALERAGMTVQVFDKGRVAGGRMATRRFEGALFDHGAQFAVARGLEFQAALESWRDVGAAALWAAASAKGSERWGGTPDMAAIPAHLAGRLSRPPAQARHVGALHRAPEGWRVRHFPASEMKPGKVAYDGGEVAGPFGAVVVALPAPQASSILASAGHAFAEAAASATYAPCWALLACFATRIDLPDSHRRETGPIAWSGRESSKPARAPSPERFVFHASADWSRNRLEDAEPNVRAALLEGLPPTVAAVAHRWRYARVERALGAPCLWDSRSGLGACGDWCLGGRVEAAWDSGRALAAAMLEGR